MKALRMSCLLLPLLAAAQERLPPVPPTAVAPSPARLIERLELQGVKALPLALFESAAKPWLGRPLDEGEIEALRQRLTRVYVDHGFVNSGLLLVQEQGSGPVLRLQAIEGRLTQVQLRGLAGLNPEHVKARLGGTEGALNMDALRERFQLLLNDPLLARVQGAPAAGRAPGRGGADIEVERAPLEAQRLCQQPSPGVGWRGGAGPARAAQQPQRSGRSARCAAAVAAGRGGLTQGPAAPGLAHAAHRLGRPLHATECGGRAQ
ncbi:MAG: POTRA domain-containing protein [Inhella sp.]